MNIIKEIKQRAENAEALAETTSDIDESIRLWAESAAYYSCLTLIYLASEERLKARIKRERKRK